MEFLKKVIRPFDNEKKVSARLHFSSNYWEELETAFPEIMGKYYTRNLESLNTLLEILEAIRQSGEYNEGSLFPLTLEFSLRTEETEKIDQRLLDPLGEGKLFLYEFSGRTSSLNGLIDFLNRYLYLSIPWRVRYNWFPFSSIAGIWIQAKIYPKRIVESSKITINENQNILLFYGNIIFSASPVDIHMGEMEIITSQDTNRPYFGISHALEAFCAQYSPDAPFIVNKNELKVGCLSEAINDQVFDVNVTPDFVKFYNVGQGNYVQIHFLGDSDERNILFDVGYAKYIAPESENYVKSAANEMLKIHPDMVILSHWDSDHINGILASNKDIFHAVWVVPDIQKLCWGGWTRHTLCGLSEFAFRVLAYLIKYHSHQLYMISEDISQQCIYESPGGSLKLWTGCRKSTSSRKKGCPGLKYVINRQNNFGLMGTVCNAKSLVLPGDCDYRLMNFEGKIDFEYVMASHHCSQMGNFPFQSSNGTAIISYGLHNPYGHPNSCKKYEMQCSGYEVKDTTCVSYIKIDF